MMRKFSVIVSGSAIVGMLFLFPTKEFLKENGLMLGLSYNDHVLIGTLTFIVAIVAAYKLLLNRRKSN